MSWHLGWLGELLSPYHAAPAFLWAVAASPQFSFQIHLWWNPYQSCDCALTRQFVIHIWTSTSPSGGPCPLLASLPCSHNHCVLLSWRLRTLPTRLEVMRPKPAWHHPQSFGRPLGLQVVLQSRHSNRRQSTSVLQSTFQGPRLWRFGPR